MRATSPKPMASVGADVDWCEPFLFQRSVMCAREAHIGVGSSVPASVPKLGPRTIDPDLLAVTRKETASWSTALAPSETVSQRFQAAHLEVLKGLRALLDEQIAARSEPPRQGTKISVE
jgi:hypothetical protein